MPLTPALQQIIRLVSTIDIKAAEYIKERAINGTLTDRAYRSMRYPNRALIMLFTWSSTPQGSMYWNNLHQKCCELPLITPKGNTP